MGRRRKLRSSPAADTTASTPEVNHPKKTRQDDEVSIQTILSKNRYSTGGTAVNDSDLDGFGEELENQHQEQQAKSTKVPPLMVKSLSLDQLKQAMKSINVSAAYKLCRIGIKVVLVSKEEYETARKFLERNKIEFFTFDMPSEKPFKAVIRGLPHTDVEGIKSDLELRYKLKPLAVYPMSRHNKDMEERDCLYLVHFPKGSVTLGALSAVRMILEVIVSWEGYRGTNKDVTQCMRCLNFGHGTIEGKVQSLCARSSHGFLPN